MEHKDFLKKTACLIQKAYEFNLKKRKRGDLELYDCLDENALKQRDIFELGLKLVADGTDSDYIVLVLSNMVNMEQNETARRFKTIQKEAVLRIHEGLNSWLLICALLAFIKDDERPGVQSYVQDTAVLEFFRM